MEKDRLVGELPNNKFGMEMTVSPKDWEVLGDEYGIKPSEIATIDFNRSGIFLPNNEVKQDFRVRFKGKMLDDHESWYALPVRDHKDTPFSANSGELYFGNFGIGSTDELMLDTCESSYQRPTPFKFK